MSTNISFGDGNAFNGDVIAADTIRDSFNLARAAKHEELGEALQTLTGEVGKTLESLTAQQQKQVARRLKNFIEEANQDEPDRSFLEITGDGLISAAKAVSGMLDPVTKAVKAILALV